MVTKGLIKTGEYFDSISLMIISSKVGELEGVIDSSIMMGTDENKSILKNSGLYLPEFDDTNDSDLLVAIKAKDDASANKIIENIGEHLATAREETEETESNPKSFEQALKSLPDANLSLISVAGKYAFDEAMKALQSAVNVMLFSDNVSIEEEIELKNYAAQKELFVMGPDCGTAIINGVPLAFANVVNKGDIGIVAAAGTGLQEVSCIISNNGGGISQAIGTGGRDVKKEIGGTMFIQGIEALNNDPNTKSILLVSKPPHPEVLTKIGESLKKVKKPVVAIFLGADAEEITNQYGIKAADTLNGAARMILSLPEEKTDFESIAKAEAKKLNKQQNKIKGLFSGGTLASETEIIIGDGHSIIDYGDDEYTVGKPHPMIDFSTRNQCLLKEKDDPSTAVILLDIVLGYGSNMDPLSAISPILSEIKNCERHIPVVCSVVGTERDPQNRSSVVQGLESLGVIVMDSNADASRLAKAIIEKI